MAQRLWREGEIEREQKDDDMNSSINADKDIEGKRLWKEGGLLLRIAPELVQ
jgi:hypothetical protein